MAAVISSRLPETGNDSGNSINSRKGKVGEFKGGKDGDNNDMLLKASDYQLARGRTRVQSQFM
jgi:hypothetical protein